MGWYDKDLYTDPEHFGLEVIWELNDPNASYSFDIFVVWKHTETGKIYWAEDAGCSCPSPFEDYTSLDHATEVISMHDFMDEVAEYFNSLAPWNYDPEGGRINWETLEIDDHQMASFKADCVELIQKVREA